MGSQRGAAPLREMWPFFSETCCLVFLAFVLGMAWDFNFYGNFGPSKSPLPHLFKPPLTCPTPADRDPQGSLSLEFGRWWASSQKRVCRCPN